MSTLNNALAAKDINGDGREDVLIPQGILWMQGEADAAFTEDIALEYYANLKKMMELIRAAFRQDDLPVVIGKISDSAQNEVGKYGGMES